MATLIICPVCETRYQTQAVFPPEGRKVRCSKCAHVWQAMPVTAPAEPAFAATPSPEAAVAPQPPAPPPPPQPRPAAATVNTAMRGFAGITQAPPPESSLSSRLARAETQAEFGGGEDFAAQTAHFNDDAAAAPEAAPEKSRGLFARLSAKRPAALDAAPPVDAGMGDAAMGDAAMGDAAMADVAMEDAAMTDAGLDPALVAAAMAGLDDGSLPQERPARKRPPVALGWALLLLLVAGVIGFLAFAPSTVMSILPGAARLYDLVGIPVGSHGLAFQGVRYGWTSDGGQPVLEVQGDVVNVTSGALEIPAVVIALRNESGEEISEWTTEVGEPELAAGEHAPFLRQIPSPPSNVRSVKVRFAKAN